MEKRLTPCYNAPCAASWDEEWTKRVGKCERSQGRAVCGACTPAGTPCILPPNHENGRCKFHGGFDCTGAQPGNRNGVIHGLYARGLQRCGAHCPMWGHCPVPCKELERVPRSNRPVCPYERTHYQIAFTDARERLERTRDADALDEHVAHQTALLQVMVTRASAAMSVSPLVQETHVKTGNYAMRTEKTAAALTAFTKLSAEYRRYLALLGRESAVPQSRPAASEDAARKRYDTLLTPEAEAELQRTPPPGSREARGCLEDAKGWVAGVREREPDAVKERTVALFQKYFSRKDFDTQAAYKRERKEMLADEQERAAREIGEYRANATACYEKAFAPAPELREQCKADPAHEPSLFPD